MINSLISESENNFKVINMYEFHQEVMTYKFMANQENIIKQIRKDFLKANKKLQSELIAEFGLEIVKSELESKNKKFSTERITKVLDGKI